MQNIKLIFLSLLSFSALANSIVQPKEIVEATPLTPFSLRAQDWVFSQYTKDQFDFAIEDAIRALNEESSFQNRSASGFAFSLRGSQSADRVLSLYNGLPLNLGDGLGASELLIPYEQFQQINVFKGPASVFYGSSAMGGAINFMPQVFTTSRIRLSALSDFSGPNGESDKIGIERGQRGQIFLAAPLYSKNSSANFGQVTHFMAHDSGDFGFKSSRLGTSGERNQNRSHLQRTVANFKSQWRTWDINHDYLFAKKEFQYPGSLDVPFSGKGETTAGLVSLAAERKLKKDTTLNIRISGIFVDSIFDEDVSESKSLSKRGSISAGIQYKMSEQLHGHSYVDYQYDDYKATFVNDDTFVKNEYDFSQLFTVSLDTSSYVQIGGRYIGRDRTAVGNFGLFKNMNDIQTYVTFSQGFRSPTLTSLYANNPSFIGNPDLESERSEQIEIGFKKQAEQTTKYYIEGQIWGLSAFSINYDDFIENVDIGGSVFQPFNRSSVEIFGGESFWGYASGFWTSRFSLTYMDAKDSNTDEKIRLIPEVKASAQFSVQLGPIVLELVNTYWGEYLDTLNNELVNIGDFDLVDLNIFTRGLSTWTIKGGIKNIFNEDYELALGYPEPQRQIYFSAERKF